MVCPSISERDPSSNRGVGLPALEQCDIVLPERQESTTTYHLDGQVPDTLPPRCAHNSIAVGYAGRHGLLDERVAQQFTPHGQHLPVKCGP